MVMLTPWKMSTRPRASVYQRPRWAIDACCGARAETPETGSTIRTIAQQMTAKRRGSMNIKFNGTDGYSCRVSEANGCLLLFVTRSEWGKQEVGDGACTPDIGRRIRNAQ